MISHHIGKRWIAGKVACSVFVFSNFLGINAGSMSILAFTVEIYIAICRPLISQRYFTAHRTNLWILALWLVTLVYCAPWLYLTDVRPDPDIPTIQLCDFRTSTRHFTRYYFLVDLVLFYLIPLIVAIVVYTKIGSVLHRADQGTLMRATGADEERADKSIDDTENSSSLRRQIPQDQIAAGAALSSSNSVTPSTCQTISPEINEEDRHQQRDKKTSRDRAKSRAHILRMLFVIVLLFIITWLPYRGVLVYNTFASEPWLHLWFLFFAKTLIYFNSAMNPLLYSAMNLRFRKSLHRTITCRPPFDDR
ncbi:hypothetical protein RvY_13410-2 [Ramazzottius varieornatus]|uniref:Thyrotropin-releasing hormone receptor n=1 Tax=Ramazzottius varieornatus TaxID=947166 RepID=A0A1D1VPY2_RAMVA|nr:hypothetical protein RvY_13410-2 [Ramazzottius varieornatus]